MKTETPKRLPFAVSVKNLSYKYPTAVDGVLTNLTFDIPQGSFFSILGPSGCGKSTLLMLLRGFHQEIGGTLDGEIRLNNLDVSKTPITELGKTVGIVFQNPALQLHQLRVIDEVASAPMYQGLPYSQAIQIARTLIDQLLGQDFFNRSPNELSAGQQQKVAVAASLALNPEILLLDEPFSFLDSTAKKELLSLLLGLQKQGKTIVVATHDVDLVASASTHLALMNRGRIVVSGNPQEVLYSIEFPKIMPPPLFVEMVKKTKLSVTPLSWRQLPDIKFKETKVSRKKVNEKTLISLKDINFNYAGSKNGLKNFSLDINHGEILGMIGQNGSGKTTVAKIIIGLLKPSSGKILFENKDISSLPLEKRAEIIGYATQDPLDMFFESNIWDEVAAGPRFKQMPDPKKRAKISLKQYHLWGYKDRHPDSISGGEKSRLGLADVTVSNPQVLLLDEPEFGLDPGNLDEISKYLLKLKNSGKAIIVISQDLEWTLFLCDRLALVKEGAIVKVGKALEILKDKSLLERAGLNPLPFSDLLQNFINTKLTKESFLQNLSQKEND